jgi:hypothetical protein
MPIFASLAPFSGLRPLHGDLSLLVREMATLRRFFRFCP